MYIVFLFLHRHLLSAILNSVMLALDDSGIPVTEKFASVCLMLSMNNEILPDPCLWEEEHDVEVEHSCHD